MHIGTGGGGGRGKNAPIRMTSLPNPGAAANRRPAWWAAGLSEFAGDLSKAHFVRIASMMGWWGIAVFLFGAVAGIIHRVEAMRC